MSNNRTRARLLLATWALGLFAAALLDDPRRRFASFLAVFGVATAAWLSVGRRADTFDKSTLRLAFGLGVIARALFLMLAPAFSEDVFRYVYEGRLVWALGPGAPFSFPPAEAPEMNVPAPLLDEAWLRINHPEISTIYPPFAQLMFTLAGAACPPVCSLGSLNCLFVLKGLLLSADLGTWYAVVQALRKKGRPIAQSLWYGLCPLVIWESTREGHVDVLSALGLALGIWGFVAARPRMGYIGFALAALAKLNGLVVLPAALRSTLRGSGFAFVLLLGLAIPFALSGTRAGVGLTQYATRWQAGDGAFSILLWLSETLLGGDWVRIGEFVVTRHETARALSTLLFGIFTLVLLARRPRKAEVPDRAACLLLALLLLSPTLHPWYAIWLVPFAATAAGPRLPLIALVAVAPILHYASHRELLTGQWEDPAWVRALVHGTVWLFIVWHLIRRRRIAFTDGPVRPV